MADIYNDNTYLANNPTWHEEDSSYKASKIYELLLRNNISFNTAAEFGCGAGEILVQLSTKYPNAQFKGFDISKDAFLIASQKQNEKIQFKLKDVNDVEDKFDLSLVMDVIEHLENYFSFIDAVHSKSKYTVFHIPLDMNLWSLFREQMLIESKQRVGHIHNFTENFILEILRDKGFKVIDKLYTEPSFKILSSKQKFINGLRKLLFKISNRFCVKTIGGYSIMVLAKNI